MQVARRWPPQARSQSSSIEGLVRLHAVCLTTQNIRRRPARVHDHDPNAVRSVVSARLGAAALSRLPFYRAKQDGREAVPLCPVRGSLTLHASSGARQHCRCTGDTRFQGHQEACPRSAPRCGGRGPGSRPSFFRASSRAGQGAPQMNSAAVRFTVLVFALAISAASAPPPAGRQGSTRADVVELRCEYLSEPAGIDVQTPRLSWVLAPSSTVRSQSAYRVLVASNRAVLDRNEADSSRDSGRVVSSDSMWIRYGGKPIGSGQRVYWKVRVWGDGRRRLAVERPGHLVDGPAAAVRLARQVDWRAAPEGVAEGTPCRSPGCARRSRSRRSRRGPWPTSILWATTSCTSTAEKVDDHVLSPAVSDYSKRNLYVTHEIADYWSPGRTSWRCGWAAAGT